MATRPLALLLLQPLTAPRPLSHSANSCSFCYQKALILQSQLKDFHVEVPVKAWFTGCNLYSLGRPGHMCLRFCLLMCHGRPGREYHHSNSYMPDMPIPRELGILTSTEGTMASRLRDNGSTLRCFRRLSMPAPQATGPRLSEARGPRQQYLQRSL